MSLLLIEELNNSKVFENYYAKEFQQKLNQKRNKLKIFKNWDKLSR